MSLTRSALLAISDNRWMRRNAPRAWFVRKAVRRFMPGERAEDALNAGEALAADGIHLILTQLGENITELSEADAVTAHYLDVIDAIEARSLPGQVSIKPTQLGLDIDAAQCLAHVRQLAARAEARGQYLWIDMEQHGYVDATLDVYRALREEFPRVGVCLQAYLYRTPQDLEAIIAMGGGVRLVKGAYKEPAAVAFPKKADVDAAYLTLAKRMIAADARASGFDAVFGTHDQAIIAAIRQHAAATGVACEAYEFALLYGINRGVQHELAAAGCRVRVLISYGAFWFPWYMRRLAERPANVWFVLRTMFAR